MASLNKVMLIGRLTDDPEAPRTLPNSGATVVKFRFAVGRSRKNPQTGQWMNDPNPLYLDCEVFTGANDTRNLCNVVSSYCRKGSEVYLEGELKYETWDDKNNPGQKRSKHKLNVREIQLLGGNGDGDEVPKAKQVTPVGDPTNPFGGGVGGALGGHKEEIPF